MFKFSQIFFCVGALVLVSAHVSADTNVASAQASKPVIVRNPGQPMIVRFPDGNEAMLTVKTEEKVFTPNLMLTENACMPQQSAACKISLPETVRIYAWIWSKNSKNRTGQPVLRHYTSGGRPDEPVQFYRFSFPFTESRSRLRKSALTSPFGEIKCDRNEWIPWKTVSASRRRAVKAVNWEEDFEMQNEEFLYRQNRDAPSFNSITAKYENVSMIEARDGRILLGPLGPGINMYGGTFKFPLIAYKLQLTFDHPSLADADDKMCQAKLTVDFTAVFTEVMRAFTETTHSWYTNEFVPVMTGSEEDAAVPAYQKDESWYGDFL